MNNSIQNRENAVLNGQRVTMFDLYALRSYSPEGTLLVKGDNMNGATTANELCGHFAALTSIVGECPSDEALHAEAMNQMYQCD